ncbi:uncharacterized protein MELLADRAFT_101334 [Melampsora larici-populina 98AG31]|uniref:Uncharacterized protein n=1 Tax=Melampsora larici-populina (strain 98AG31 / pathotype 3-4-7) TaxID=747676 RepID=F4R4E3_MELLP|nr:uncharacterized protein MELLADRAFT_101334 [Melampsora larici-populina 98AG31]EGG13016.1 hypothetical protein MELLADRAFT_101334 [Melampsora larici-populina 98AG31]
MNHGFQSFGHQYQAPPSVNYSPYRGYHYQPYPYASGSSQGFPQTGAPPGPSEPGNQLAIVPKPGTSNGSSQGGALAIIHRNNQNKQCVITNDRPEEVRAGRESLTFNYDLARDRKREKGSPGVVASGSPNGKPGQKA